MSSPSDYDTAPDMMEPVEISTITPRYQIKHLIYSMNVILFGCKDAKKYEYCHRKEPKPTEQAAPKDDNEEITQPPKTLLKIKGQQ